MKKQITILLIVVGMLIGVGGCATIMNGTTDTVNINSRPPDAKFSIVSVSNSGEKTTIVTGLTPQNVTLQRKTEFWGNGYTVTFEKEDFITKTILMRKSVSGWYWGNILFGGIIGVVIDASNGAADDLHDVSVRLIPVTRWQQDQPSVSEQFRELLRLTRK